MDIEGEATYFESDEGGQNMNETLENVSCTCACCGSSRYCGVLTIEDIRNHSWMTADAAYECYVSYAKSVGFGVRKGDAARGKDGNYTRRRFFCNKAGYREEKYYNNSNRKREHKAETRTGCEAKLSIYLDESSSVWRVRKLVEEHNHELIPQCLVHLIPNHRRLTDANKAQTDTMIMHGLPTSQIMGYLVGQAGGYHRVGFSKKDLDNYIERSRRARIIGGDSNATIGYLSGKADLDPMAMARYSSTPEDRLGNLFWADGMSKADYQLFGDVLAFDTTYRKNKYKKPLVIFSGSNHHRQTCIFGFAVLEDESGPTYTWLLKNFLDVMLGKSPTVVVTDGDEGMKEGIANAFPNATHRLCGWHLQKNATSNIKDPTFCAEFKKCMYGKWHPDEFELRWAKMVDTFGLQNNEWVNIQYARKKNWASSYLMDKFCAEFRTTSRCEGINNYVKTFINSCHCLLDLVTNLEGRIWD
ncbi:protein FAR1-RELATED SEQUENCE 5-like [Arachis ipaensis]|nr:protein FAR1-RELATED SEQUENCE 5-like [Arachis ipaensis]XP_025664409.1 protein FAR1-RELATED SEQUENCE 5-like [Arachis hypogaea]XP_025693546.1 protein FAR1-RELATED SEQUENCE 5-like [Arachis hypogaea]